MRLRVTAFLLVVTVLLQAGCGQARIYTKRALLMGTFVDIQIASKRWASSGHLDNIIRGAFDEIRRIERIFTLYETDNKEFMFLSDKADYFRQLTGSAFDVSLGSEDARPDFGGIAKGYAVDKAVYFLKSHGIKNAIINAGGDMYCLGRGKDGDPWRVGIRDPLQKSRNLATLLLKDRAVATSGDYERPSHIVNPKTGKPANAKMSSVTVLAKDCMTADVLATAVFVLGPEKGMELLNRLEDVEGVIISELQVHKSNGLKEIDIYGEE